MNRCCFAGHGQVYDADLEKLIKNKAEELILKQHVTEFWVGKYGNFDRCAASAVGALKKRYPHISLVLVLPYLTQSINDPILEYRKRYDEIIIANIAESTPYRLRIIKANQFMVDHASHLICYINYEWGGAVKTFEYAKTKKHITIYNLGRLS